MPGRRIGAAGEGVLHSAVRFRGVLTVRWLLQRYSAQPQRPGSRTVRERRASCS